MSVRDLTIEELDELAEGPAYMAGDQEPRAAANVIEFVGGPTFLADDWDDEELVIEPSFLPVVGGMPLFYAGESHDISGPGGSGKTWTLQLTIASIVEESSTAVCVFVDYEGNRSSFKERMKALGVTKAQAARIAYWSTSFSLMKNTPTGRTWLAWVDTHRPVFVGIDSVAKACAAAGLNDEVNPEYHRWDNGVVMPLTERGVTSLRIDHTGNDQDGKPAQRARGASSKAQAVSGASYLFSVQTPWTRTQNGQAKLTTLKDRHGHRPKGSVACEISVAVQDDGRKVAMTVSAPAGATAATFTPTRKTFYMEKISHELEKSADPLSQNQIESYVGGRATHLREALTTLVDEGFVKRTPQGRSNLHSVVKAYRQVEDPKSDKYEGPAIQEDFIHTKPARSNLGGGVFGDE